MKPFYLSVNKNVQLVILPELDAQMDGHPVLTYSYAIYKDDPDDGLQYSGNTDQLLSADRKTNPNYMGTITFEQPGKLFTYVPDGPQALSGDEVHEIIEKITQYRENPDLWTI